MAIPKYPGPGHTGVGLPGDPGTTIEVGAPVAFPFVGDVVAGPPAPMGWHGVSSKGHGYIGGRPQMEITISGSARREPLRLLVGETRLAGSLMGWAQSGDVLHVAYRWGIGPAFSIAGHELDGEALSGHPALLDGPNDHMGTSTEALDANAATAFGWGTAWRWVSWSWVSYYVPGLVDAGVGVPNLVATVKTKTWDFTDAVPAWRSSVGYDNPVLALYTYLVKCPWGPRVDSSLIHTASWEAAADWCWEAVGGLARWRCAGVAPCGSTIEVVKAFLRVAWCSMSWVDGQWRLAPRIKDTAGAEILPVTTFSRGRGSYSSQPTTVKIGFRDVDNEWLEDSRWARSAALIAGTAPWIERCESPALIGHADVAQRDATFSLDSITEENSTATVTVEMGDNPDVLDTMPGDLVWVRRPYWAADRLYRVVGVVLDSHATAYKLDLLRANATLTAEGVGSSGGTVSPPVTVAHPTAPDSCTQEFLELGPWDAVDLLPAPDLLETAGYTATDITVDDDVADPLTGEDASSLTVTAATGTVDVAFTPTADRFYATLCLRWDAAIEPGVSIKVQYQTRPTAGAWTTRRQVNITPAAARWARCGHAVDVYAADEHRLRLLVEHSGAPGSEVLWVRRFRCVDYPTDPASQVKLAQAERWGWVYAVEPTDVRGYLARRGRRVVAEAEYGETSLEWDVMVSGPSGRGLRVSGPGGASVEAAAGGTVLWTAAYLSVMLCTGYNGTLTAFPDPTQSFVEPQAPTAPSNVALRWYRNRDRRTTNSDAVDQWDQTSDKFTVTTDVADAPDGNTTADRLNIQDAAADQIQTLDSAVRDAPGANQFQMVWLKSEGVDFDLDTGSERGGSGYHGHVRVRSHWRLFRQISTYSGSGRNGPALKAVGTEPNFLAASAVSWPDSEEDTTHNEWFRLTWTPAADAATLDGYELQYRTWNLATSEAGEWTTWAYRPPGATSITWGAGPGVDAPHFQEHWTTGNGMVGEVLYDWRVVAVRGGLYTELVPTTVEELGVGRDSWLQQAADVALGTPADGDVLYWDDGTALVKAAAPGALALSVTNFDGILSAAEDTIQEAFDVLDDHAHDAAYSAIGHDHDADYVDVAGDTMTGELGLAVQKRTGSKTGLTSGVASSLFTLTYTGGMTDGVVVELEASVVGTGEGGDKRQVAFRADVLTLLFWATLQLSAASPLELWDDSKAEEGTITLALSTTASSGELTVKATVTTDLASPTIGVRWGVRHSQGTYAAV